MSITNNPCWRSRKGLHFEELAITYLEARGLRLLGRNFRCAAGEIDLVMQHQDMLVFVEVRFRASLEYGGALSTVTHRKQQKLLRAARYFLLRHKEHQQRHCRFDVVGITRGTASSHQIEWVQDAFC